LATAAILMGMIASVDPDGSRLHDPLGGPDS
jgi:hypothetical protein